nr:hypothetical protein CFP56_57761 [Quercus suber]
MKNFCKAVDRCNLRDIGYTRSDFTWCRRLGSRGWVREGLDKALVSPNWASTFPKMRLHHVAASTSNHCMLVVKAPTDRKKRTRRMKLFSFESMWLRDEGCKEIMFEAWDRAMIMGVNIRSLNVWRSVESL